ncbi:unnamed protein product [Alopecurus aequalis]
MNQQQQNEAPGSTEFLKRIHRCMVKVKGHKTYAVGVVIVSRATFCYVITDKAIFANPSSKPYTVKFPQGDSQKVQHSDVRFGDELAAFYLKKPNNTTITDAVVLSDQPVLRKQTYYLFDYTKNSMYSGLCGGNVTSVGVNTFKHDATGLRLGGPLFTDECRLIGISTSEDSSLAFGANIIKSELLGILRQDDSLVEFTWDMDDISEHIVNAYVP